MKGLHGCATYRRTQAIRYFHGCYALADDQLWSITRERKVADHTLAALKSIRARQPGGYRLFVILDILSANKTPAIRRWAAGANAGLCFTPTNASWANPIEAQIGPVRTFVMGGSDHPSHPVLARKPQDYLASRNANARHPRCPGRRRERARVRSRRQQRWGRRPKPEASAHDQYRGIAGSCPLTGSGHRRGPPFSPPSPGHPCR